MTKSTVSTADARLIRAHLDHGVGDRRVRVHHNGHVTYCGTTGHYDRSHDYWHNGGWAEELLAAAGPANTATDK